MREQINYLCVVVVFLFLSACANHSVLTDKSQALPEKVELKAVPFFPQKKYQCGPAALAAVIQANDIKADLTKLTNQVYLPGREGSLQVELVAAARSYNLLVYPVSPNLDSVLAEVASGHPVLVLQNLAFNWHPFWHFSVVVGYDKSNRQLILRSGTTRRWITDFSTFDTTWSRGERWAVVVLPVNQLPVNPDLKTWLLSASDLEETGHVAAAKKSYEVAVDRWPESPLPYFALANRLYADGEIDAAERSLRTSVKTDASFSAGWSNLARVLQEKGCSLQSKQALRCSGAPTADRVNSDDIREGNRLNTQCLVLPPCSLVEKH